MDAKPFFSIIIVCLNPGEKLAASLDSVLAQTFKGYELIIKDGLSRDGAVEAVANRIESGEAFGGAFAAADGSPLANADGSPLAISIYHQADRGIYDAMNQAVAEAHGQYVYFLNCGDLLYDSEVLAQTKAGIEAYESGVRDAEAEYDTGVIFYGEVFEMLTAARVTPNPRFDRFACFRHFPCHQSCFYRRDLLTEHPFSDQYPIRADYDLFMWAVLKKGAATHYLPWLIARYEGGGFSEAKENRRASAREHRRIVECYMGRGEIFKYRLLMALTLAPLRVAMARSKRMAGVYNWVRTLIYRGRT